MAEVIGSDAPSGFLRLKLGLIDTHYPNSVIPAATILKYFADCYTINARPETVAEKPAFRAAFRQRRCLIPTTAFSEWQARQGGKQPFYWRGAADPARRFRGG